MNAIDVYEAQRIISTKLSVDIQELISLCDAYLSGFEREELFVFSESKKRDKIYKQKYYDFVALLPSLINKMSEETAELSILLQRADNEMMLDAISQITPKIEAYLAFEVKLSEYSTSTRALVSGKNISPTLLIQKTRTLRSSAEELLKAITEALA